ncbi:hypothetical protein [Lactiplantibacillus songbeiensis]|uniref:Uncharacterized protein n=1 Tax=Lactiplantibacillus songbeiensis TaxID=2559920 RepID=A0ABW4C2G1_9LACO|nr:hypothetical protein [Lactiplantibacillus songbeiensis]
MKKLISSLILCISVFGIAVCLNNVNVSASRHSSVVTKKVSKRKTVSKKKKAKKYGYKLTNLKAKIVPYKVKKGTKINLVEVTGELKVSKKSLAKKYEVTGMNYVTCDGEWTDDVSKDNTFATMELGVLKRTKTTLFSKSSPKHVWVTAISDTGGDYTTKYGFYKLSATRKVAVKQAKR